MTLMQEFPNDRYYADEQQALEALSNGSQFNVIDFETGWKTDFIIARNSEYGRTALGRRMRIEIGGTTVYVATPEDVLLAKLQWAKLAQSERQLQDAAGIVSTQGSKLDVAYINRWVLELDLQEQWQGVRNERL